MASAGVHPRDRRCVVTPELTRSRGIMPLEPSFARLPAGLDPAIPDDRILGSALELQREHPASAVVLVTGDINLQTKAELGGLPYIEPPSATRG